MIDEWAKEINDKEWAKVVSKPKPTVRIENWSVLTFSSAYTPPEAMEVVLNGEVFGHPLHSDGKRLVTSNIRKVEGNRVETFNTIYILGDPDPKFVEWCKENNAHVPTKEEPIKVK